MDDNFCINWDNLKESANKLKTKINFANQTYQNLNNIYKVIDGTTNVWYGTNQKKFYDNYLSIANNFPKEIEKFEELYNYLLKVIEAYETSDTTSSNSVDINSDNYMM